MSDEDENGWAEYKRDVLNRLGNLEQNFNNLSEKLIDFLENADQRFVNTEQCKRNQKLDRERYLSERKLLWAAIGGAYLGLFGMIVENFI